LTGDLTFVGETGPKSSTSLNWLG